ncbi:MAG TPA: LysR family transcriptional regulator [Polyangiaceae bacterium]|nr:LysR family transcriptional regulator [Polyangiaceae bacterium]
MIYIITKMNVAHINLNLLVSFDALMTERNVTRAARRMGVTQSAMSNALAQLRQLANDPLFVRTPGGMLPTETARAWAGPVRQALSLIDGALTARAAFDPASSERRFVIAASDYVGYVLLPPLLHRLSRAAPRVRFDVRPWGRHEVPPTLATGEVDLMLGFYDRIPTGHHEQILFEERYVCIVRKGHPGIGRRLTLAKYLELAHILVSETGESGSVDRALAEIGQTRRIGLRVSHFLMVPPLVAATDLVAALSQRVAAPFARPLSLQIFPPPIALPISKIGQVWHEQTDRDPANRWLRGILREIAQRV